MKILIAGAAGFFGSNIIRYLLYRLKNIEIIGIDNIPDVEKANLRLYHHRKHRFYVCDINSSDFDKILELENPDLIIDTIISQNDNDSKNMNTKIGLLNKNIPTLSLVSDISMIKISLKTIAEQLDNSHIIEVPICFGFRESSLKGISKIVYGALEGRLEGNFGIYSWLYIEELSKIILEMIQSKNPKSIRIQGYEFSEMEIANFCYSYARGEESKSKVKGSQKNNKVSFEDSLKKTVDWYKANAWSKGIK